MNKYHVYQAYMGDSYTEKFLFSFEEAHIYATGDFLKVGSKGYKIIQKISEIVPYPGNCPSVYYLMVVDIDLGLFPCKFDKA